MKTFKQLREAENCFINPTVGPLGSENAVDTPDAAIFDVASPESIRLLNVYLAQVARGEPSFNPYDRVRMVQKKLSTVGLNFILPNRLGNKKLDLAARVKGSLMGQWKEFYPLSYLGGRTGVLDNMHNIGTDDNITHRTGHGLVMVAKFSSYGDEGIINLSMKITRSDDPSLNEGYYADKFKARYKDAKDRHFNALQKMGNQPRETNKHKVKNKYNTTTTKSKSGSGRSSSTKVKGSDSTTTTTTNIKKGHGFFRTVKDGILSRLSGAASATLKTGASMAKDALVGGSKAAAKGSLKLGAKAGKAAVRGGSEYAKKAGSWAKGALTRIKAGHASRKKAKAFEIGLKAHTQDSKGNAASGKTRHDSWLKQRRGEKLGMNKVNGGKNTNTKSSASSKAAKGRTFTKVAPTASTKKSTTTAAKASNSNFKSFGVGKIADRGHATGAGVGSKMGGWAKKFNATSSRRKAVSGSTNKPGEKKALSAGGQGSSTTNSRRAIRVPGATNGRSRVHVAGSGQKALPPPSQSSTSSPTKKKATKITPAADTKKEPKKKPVAATGGLFDKKTEASKPVETPKAQTKETPSKKFGSFRSKRGNG